MIKLIWTLIVYIVLYFLNITGQATTDNYIDYRTIKLKKNEILNNNLGYPRYFYHYEEVF